MIVAGSLGLWAFVDFVRANLRPILNHDMTLFCGPVQGLLRGGHRSFQVAVRLDLPRSAGRLTLESADPKDRPVINFGYLSDPTDLPRLRDGVRKGLRILCSEGWISCHFSAKFFNPILSF